MAKPSRANLLGSGLSFKVASICARASLAALRFASGHRAASVAPAAKPAAGNLNVSFALHQPTLQRDQHFPVLVPRFPLDTPSAYQDEMKCSISSGRSSRPFNDSYLSIRTGCRARFSRRAKALRRTLEVSPSDLGVKCFCPSLI
jgi:hypothetical protein